MLGYRVQNVRLAVWLLCMAIALSSARAQEEDEESPYRPGLIATYSAGGQSAVRTDEASRSTGKMRPATRGCRWGSLPRGGMAACGPEAPANIGCSAMSRAR